MLSSASMFTSRAGGIHPALVLRQIQIARNLIVAVRVLRLIINDIPNLLGSPILEEQDKVEVSLVLIPVLNSRTEKDFARPALAFRATRLC